MNARWVAKVAASAAIRRVVYVILALALGYLGIGSARADDHPDKSSAVAHAIAETPQACAGTAVLKTELKHLSPPQSGPINKSVERFWSCGTPTGSPPQNGWNNGLEVHFYPPLNCAARIPRYGGWEKAGKLVCDNGCVMKQSTTPVESDEVNTGNNITHLLRSNWVPTGVECPEISPPPEVGPPKDDYCVDLPMGHKICKDAQGRNCVVSGKTGRKYCPTDGAPSVSPDRTEGATKAPGNAPGNKPSPRAGEEWVDGPGATTTNSQGSGCTSNCGTTTNTTTVVGNSGRPNTNPGDGTPGDGSDNPGEPGDGEDKDPGEASGGGTCDAAPTCSGKPVECAILQQQWKARCENKSGNAGDGLGTLYEGSDRTVGDAFGDFQTRIGDAPLIDAGGQFFSVNASGSCPVFSVPATEFWEPLTFDYHCSGDLNSFLLLGGYLVLAVAAFEAFKIAVY